jgi:hypothetical protein
VLARGKRCSYADGQVRVPPSHHVRLDGGDGGDDGRREPRRGHVLGADEPGHPAHRHGRILRQVIDAVVCSSPAPRLSLDLVQQLVRLHNEAAPDAPHEHRCLLVLDPGGETRAKAAARFPGQTEYTVSSPVLARRVTVAVSASDGWEVESVSPVSDVPGFQLAATSAAFCISQVGHAKIRVAFRRCSDGLAREVTVGIRVESEVYRLALAIHKAYDAFFHAALLQNIESGAGLQEALLNLCLSVNDDLQHLRTRMDDAAPGLLGLARAIGAGDMLDGLDTHLHTIEEDLGKALDTGDAQALSKLHQSVFHFIASDSSGGGFASLMTAAFPPVFRPQPSTLDPRPSTLDPRPSSLDRQPQTVMTAAFTNIHLVLPRPSHGQQQSSWKPSGPLQIRAGRWPPSASCAAGELCRTRLVRDVTDSNG